jgi:hypothetical protein
MGAVDAYRNRVPLVNEGPSLSAMLHNYDPEAWAAATTRGRRIFNYNYHLSGRELEGWTLVKRVAVGKGEAVEQVYLWRGQTKDREARVSVVELRHWREAQRRLYEDLTNSMRPDIPTGTGKLSAIGDVNFLGNEPNTNVPAAIVFTRANVYVAVRSIGAQSVDVSGLAFSVDNALDEPSAAVKRKLARPRSSNVNVEASQAHAVVDQIQKELPPEGWLKIVAPDGELSRRDGTIVYTSPKPGKKVIFLYRMGVSGR